MTCRVFISNLNFFFFQKIWNFHPNIKYFVVIFISLSTFNYYPQITSINVIFIFLLSLFVAAPSLQSEYKKNWKKILCVQFFFSVQCSLLYYIGFLTDGFNGKLNLNYFNGCLENMFCWLMHSVFFKIRFEVEQKLHPNNFSLFSHFIFKIFPKNKYSIDIYPKR